jgi:hypothetical protein
MNGFVLLISVVYHLTVGGPDGGSAANFSTATFADEQACRTAARKAQELVENQFAQGAMPRVSAACVPQSSTKK